MAGRIATFAAKKALSKEMDKYRSKDAANKTDPYFQEIKLPNGRIKKVRKQIPDWVSERDAKRLKRVKKLAYIWDIGLFDFVGVRFGWGSVFGLIPGIGDAIDFGMALWIWSLCCFRKDAKVGFWTGLWMLLRVVGDLVLGVIPFVGDLADAAYKCNTKNVADFEQKVLYAHKPEGMELDDAMKSRLVDMDDGSQRTYNEKDNTKADSHRTKETAKKSQKGRGRGWYGNHDRSRRDDVEMGTKPGPRGGH